MELTDIDREEIARLIQEGNTGGMLDNEGNENEKRYRISWELRADKWSDDE